MVIISFQPVAEARPLKKKQFKPLASKCFREGDNLLFSKSALNPYPVKDTASKMTDFKKTPVGCRIRRKKRGDCTHAFLKASTSAGVLQLNKS